MTTTESDTGGRGVTWTVFPDHDADRFRLVVLRLADGVPVVIGLAVPVLLVFMVADGFAVENVGGAVLVVVLALIGGPASLVYLLLAVEYGSEREVQKLTPPIGWFRLRYIPVNLLGGGILLLSSAIQPVIPLVYPIGVVVCKRAVDLRYTVGRIDPKTASLREVSGAAAVEYTDDWGLDTRDREVRTFDIPPLGRVYQWKIGDHTVFVPRYQSRRRWVDRSYSSSRTTSLPRPRRLSIPWSERTTGSPGDGLDRAVRIVLGGLGGLFIGTTGGFAVVEDGAFPIVAYVAATLGLLV
jgi:hypothetical protein